MPSLGPCLGVGNLLIDLRRNHDSSVFETTIRVVGGLLAAYDLSGDAMFARRWAIGLQICLKIEKQLQLQHPEPEHCFKLHHLCSAV